MTPKPTQQESRVEYRVVRSDGLPGRACDASLEEMEAHCVSMEAEDPREFRIQGRTVVTTPWEDVDDV